VRELEQFDEESARRGISALALNEPPRELYEDDPKSGSMLSLVHSNSSTSVGPNSL